MASQDDRDKLFGATLKELRVSARLSQEDLAYSAGVDQSLLSKIERLGPGAMSWHRICRIANALGHDVEIRFAKKDGA